MKHYKLAIAVTTLVLSTNVNATFIDNGDYISDAGTGLDWMDVTTTQNQSYDYVFSQLGSGGIYEGWRYALHGEVRSLYDGPEGNYANPDWYTALGITGTQINSDGTTDWDYVEGIYNGVSSWTGADWRTIGFTTTTLNFYGDIPADVAYASLGSWLVRDSIDSTSISVPEPATFALMSLGLVGICFSRRSKIKGLAA